MTSPRILIVQTGRAIASVRSRLGDFPHWFRVAMGLPPHAVQVVDVQHGDLLPDWTGEASYGSDWAGEASYGSDWAGEASYGSDWAGEASHGFDRATEASHHGYAGVIVTGSNSMVSDREPWSEATAAWIRDTHAAGVPLLGVCYGHQLIAHAFGGRVDYHPQGREMGTHPVERLDAAQDDDLLGAAPVRFSAQLTHRQSVLEPPQGAVVLARSAHDPVQAFRIGGHTWGVQFHPEFSTAAMRGYIAARRDDLARENTCPRTLAGTVHAAPHARAILRRFASLALSRARARA